MYAVFVNNRNYCGSGLAREGGVSVNIDVECEGGHAVVCAVNHCMTGAHAGWVAAEGCRHNE